MPGSYCPLLEIKSSRAVIGRDIALPDSFHSFFSFPASKGGYATVTTASQRRPEEGLSGGLQPKIPLNPNDLLTLDLGGRALVLDFGLFVLINLHFPNEGSDARFSYKMNYHLMLQEHVRHPARAWIRDWLEPRGPLIDVLKRFWPDRKGMFTCTCHISTCCDSSGTYKYHGMVPLVRFIHSGWNTKVSARETNYGTRIDYVLVTPGLMPWIKAADIQPSIKGSDHCPIFVDLHDGIITDAGEKLVLRELMHIGAYSAKREPPRLAVKYWPEFQGKQLLMSNFFTKRCAEALPAPQASGSNGSNHIT
ncbi:Endonuclease/exonuclease/phosphatase [Russula emetica]|nr:Endonuclease/exonuclease/phosphatase [Russula emetica]